MDVVDLYPEPVPLPHASPTGPTLLAFGSLSDNKDTLFAFDPENWAVREIEVKDGSSRQIADSFVAFMIDATWLVALWRWNLRKEKN